jgi:hypothetical protein
MTDPLSDEIDARLKAAGREWRASEPAALSVDVESSRVMLQGDVVATQRWRRSLIPASAALAVLAVAFAAVMIASTHRGARHPPTGGLAALVVTNGEMVRATGQVFRSEHGIQLCVNVFATAAGSLGGPDSSTLPELDCRNDHLADLAGLEVRGDGVVITGTNTSPLSGDIQVTGRLDDDTITVKSLAAVRTALPPPRYALPRPSRWLATGRRNVGDPEHRCGAHLRLSSP